MIHASGQRMPLWREPESMEDQQDAEFNKRVDDTLSTLILVMDDVHDPRGRQGKRHVLTSILSIVVLGCLCGCDDAEALEDWANKEESWLTKYLELRWGVPSQETFLRVLAMIDAGQFRLAFARWIRRLFPKAAADGQSAIDGQTARRGGDKAAEKSAVHMVSALACEARVVLGQYETPSKTNELTAIRRLLDLIPLRGALVSFDAMGCQTSVAARITNRDADYLLAVRDNQPTLRAQIELAFEVARPGKTKNVDLPDPPQTEAHCASDAGHGRIETRTTTVIHEFEDYLDVAEKCAGLTTLVRVDSVREHEGSDFVENAVRYYISSRHLSAEEAGKHVRRQWDVENKRHYVLDVSFGEDSYTARKKNAAANFIVIPHFAVNLIRAFSRDKMSVPRRRRLCDYRPEYREQLLADVAM